MKKTILLLSLIAIASFTEGCRREDFREHVFEVPGMTQANTNSIKERLFVYDGVDMKSLDFNLEKKTLKVRFDSMRIAQTNIRAAIEGKKEIEGNDEDKKIEVTYPEKSGESAGYINKRDKEVK